VLVTASPEPFAVLATVVVVVPLLTSVWSVLDADAVLLPLVLLVLLVVVSVPMTVLLLTSPWLLSEAVVAVLLSVVLALL